MTKADVDGFDAIVHFAALSNDPLGNLNAGLTYDINHRASVRLAELAKAAGVARFVLSSSCSTYGAAGDDFHDETAALIPSPHTGNPKSLRSATSRNWLMTVSVLRSCGMRRHTEFHPGCGWTLS